MPPLSLRVDDACAKDSPANLHLRERSKEIRRHSSSCTHIRPRDLIPQWQYYVTNYAGDSVTSSRFQCQWFSSPDLVSPFFKPSVTSQPPDPYHRAKPGHALKTSEFQLHNPLAAVALNGPMSNTQDNIMLLVDAAQAFSENATPDYKESPFRTESEGRGLCLPWARTEVQMCPATLGRLQKNKPKNRQGSMLGRKCGLYATAGSRLGRPCNMSNTSTRDCRR